jgi:hypothetical protein
VWHLCRAWLRDWISETWRPKRAWRLAVFMKKQTCSTCKLRQNLQWRPVTCPSREELDNFLSTRSYVCSPAKLLE